MTKNEIRLIIRWLCIGCAIFYIFFFILSFLGHFVAVFMVYEKTGIFRYELSWGLIIKNAKFALIGLPLGLLATFLQWQGIKNRS